MIYSFELFGQVQYDHTCEFIIADIFIDRGDYIYSITLCNTKFVLGVELLFSDIDQPKLVKMRIQKVQTLVLTI